MLPAQNLMNMLTAEFLVGKERRRNDLEFRNKEIFVISAETKLHKVQQAINNLPNIKI